MRRSISDVVGQLAPIVLNFLSRWFGNALALLWKLSVMSVNFFFFLTTIVNVSIVRLAIVPLVVFLKTKAFVLVFHAHCASLTMHTVLNCGKIIQPRRGISEREETDRFGNGGFVDDQLSKQNASRIIHRVPHRHCVSCYVMHCIGLCN